MRVRLRLFGAMRQFQPGDALALDVPDHGSIGDVRAALAAHAAAQWPAQALELLRASAFASDSDILRDDAAIPADGDLAILPPVNGG